MADLLSVGGVLVLILALGLSIPHWLKRWRMALAFSDLQGVLGGGEIESSLFGWPRFSGAFQGRPCQIRFHTTLVNSAHGALGDLAARYRVGMTGADRGSLSLERPSFFSRWFGGSNGSARTITIGEVRWRIVEATQSEALQLVSHPDVTHAIKQLAVCKMIRLDREWAEVLEVEVARQELRADRFVAMLTNLSHLAAAAEHVGAQGPR
jgi:hypothetical protein